MYQETTRPVQAQRPPIRKRVLPLQLPCSTVTAPRPAPNRRPRCGLRNTGSVCVLQLVRRKHEVSVLEILYRLRTQGDSKRQTDQTCAWKLLATTKFNPFQRRGRLLQSTNPNYSHLLPCSGAWLVALRHHQSPGLWLLWPRRQRPGVGACATCAPLLRAATP
jgi:hypothetical protein